MNHCFLFLLVCFISNSFLYSFFFFTLGKNKIYPTQVIITLFMNNSMLSAFYSINYRHLQISLFILEQFQTTTSVHIVNVSFEIYSNSSFKYVLRYDICSHPIYIQSSKSIKWFKKRLLRNCNRFPISCMPTFLSEQFPERFIENRKKNASSRSHLAVQQKLQIKENVLF